MDLPFKAAICNMLNFEALRCVAQLIIWFYGSDFTAQSHPTHPQTAVLSSDKPAGRYFSSTKQQTQRLPTSSVITVELQVAKEMDVFLGIFDGNQKRGLKKTKYWTKTQKVAGNMTSNLFNADTDKVSVYSLLCCPKVAKKQLISKCGGC